VPEKRGGRKHLIECSPELEPGFKIVLQEHTAGDPMKPDCLWTNLSLQAMSRLMIASGFQVSPYLVEQLLEQCKLGHRQAFKYLTMRQHKDRNQQFEILLSYKQSFLESLNPIISIDTKKRELLGCFWRKGRLYTAEGREVFDHDFPSFAKGVVIPHGIYDLKRNRGYVNLGTSHDTSEFACDSIFQWWNAEGRSSYPQAKELLLLCDGGGSNSASQFLFKDDLQKLTDRMGITIRVAHYPPYCSKYNPIEHRLFPHLTRACQGIILECVEQAQYYMSKAATQTGLKVVVNILDKVYQTGRAVAEGFRKTMKIVFDKVLPKLNYKAIPAAA
jgi:Rhodopirellula transposase DDE domain